MSDVPDAWVLRTPCGRYIAFQGSKYPFTSYRVSSLSDAHLFFDPQQIAMYDLEDEPDAELYEVTLGPKGDRRPEFRPPSLEPLVLSPTAWERLLGDDSFVCREEAIQCGNG